MAQDQTSSSKSCKQQAQSNPLSGQGATISSRGADETHQKPAVTFSIATPTVTTILPMTENINDTSFMLPATSCQHDSTVEELLKRAEATNNDQATQDQKPSHSCGAEPNSAHQSMTNPQEDGLKGCKKKTKINKKSTKLDAKSKLEKSRQSARECRARKKLRYQYLEDLVTNREKAVIKLRDELSMFCELSKKIDIGSINEADRKLLIDQTKENSD